MQYSLQPPIDLQLRHAPPYEQIEIVPMGAVIDYSSPQWVESVVWTTEIKCQNVECLESQLAFCCLEPCGCALCRGCLNEMLRASFEGWQGIQYFACASCQAVVVALHPLSALESLESPPLSTSTDITTVSPMQLRADDHEPFPSEAQRRPIRRSAPPRERREQQRPPPGPRTLYLNAMGAKLQSFYIAIGENDHSIKEPSYPVLQVHNIDFSWTVSDIEDWVVGALPGALPGLDEHGASVHLFASPWDFCTLPYALIEARTEEAAEQLMRKLNHKDFRERAIPVRNNTPGYLLVHCFPHSAELFLAPEKLYEAGQAKLPREFADYLEMASVRDVKRPFYAHERAFRVFASLLTVFPFSHVRDPMIALKIYESTIQISSILFERIRAGGFKKAQEAAEALLHAVKACRGFTVAQKNEIERIFAENLPNLPALRGKAGRSVERSPQSSPIERALTPIETVRRSVQRRVAAAAATSGAPAASLQQARTPLAAIPVSQRSISLDMAQAARFPLPPPGGYSPAFLPPLPMLAPHCHYVSPFGFTGQMEPALYAPAPTAAHFPLPPPEQSPK